MSNLSQFISQGVGKLRYQEFTSSGTFTPSAALLANGGQCYYELIGGGASGSVGVGNVPGIGGDAGKYKCGVITVSGATTITIGAGGAAVSSAASNTAGNAGSPSTIGALATAAGGVATPTGGQANYGCGGAGAGGIGHFTTDTSYTFDARGGVGVNGLAGGGGGSATYGALHMRGVDGGGNGAYSTIGGAATATAGAPNTGGGGGGASNDNTVGLKTSGAGGSGWARLVWFE